MIQRYTLYNPCFIETRSNLEVDDGGDLVLYDDVKDLIEWRDFTERSDIKDGCNYLIWLEGEPEEIIAYYGDGEFCEDCGVTYTIADRIKWKSLDPNPWTTK